MKLSLLGVGGAGGRIVDAIRAAERETSRSFSDGEALVCDVTETGVVDLDHVARDRQVTIGDTHEAVDGRGVDGDVDLAVEIARADLPEIRRALDAVTMRDLDGVLVVAGLGGGTGGGATAVVVEALQEMYDKPVYVLGVLPGEAEGRTPARNAARALRSIVPIADSTILFDNDRWIGEAPADDGDGAGHTDADRAERHASVNRDLAARVTTLFAVGNLGTATIGATSVDSSDVVRTLAPGGVCSIGYEWIELDDDGGLLAWLRSLLGGGGDDDRERTDAGRIKRLVQGALGSGLTLPCATDSAERVMVVLSGPTEALSRRGFESARGWLEAETDTVDVRAGDDPRPGADRVAAVVLLSNVTEVERIDRLQRQALERDLDLERDVASEP